MCVDVHNLATYSQLAGSNLAICIYWGADTSRCKKAKHAQQYTLRPIDSHLYLVHAKQSMALYNAHLYNYLIGSKNPPSQAVMMVYPTR